MAKFYAMVCVEVTADQLAEFNKDMETQYKTTEELAKAELEWASTNYASMDIRNFCRTLGELKQKLGS